MTVDSEEQRKVMLTCIHVAAANTRVDASDEALAGHAALVKLRRAVEGAALVVPEPSDA